MKTVKELAKSASRALSALYTKSLRAGGMTLNVFEKLYESLVEPVLFYASGIWGISDSFTSYHFLSQMRCAHGIVVVFRLQCAFKFQADRTLVWSAVVVFSVLYFL